MNRIKSANEPAGGFIQSSSRKFLVGVIAIGACKASAEVVLDGKFGNSGAIAGPNFSIPADAGATRGNNLFHSFRTFNLSAGESATFSGPANIQNILARVTGGAPSSINGTVRSEIAGANLFLLNPNGILFGPGAALDVSGSFTASTADYLKLADGASFFAALDADDSQLTTAPVASFGFLGAKPASISVEQANLVVASPKDISLVAGDISLNGGILLTLGGDIHLASVQAPGEITPLSDLGSAHGGTIALHNSSALGTIGESGGRVVIRGGQLTVADSIIESNTIGEGKGKGVDIAVHGTIEVSHGGQINSLSPDAVGQAGNVDISAHTVRLDGSHVANEFGQPTTQISASSGNILTTGEAKAGDIKIRSSRVEILNSARISADSFGPGDAGHVQIEADALVLDATDDPKLETVTQISADNVGFQGGKGGDILVRARAIDVLDGASISSWTIGSAPAGLIDIQAEYLNILNGSFIGTPTLGEGQAGNIHIAAGRIRIDGNDGGILAITFPSDSQSAGGNVQIKSDVLEILNSGFIGTTSFSSGRGGDIDIATGILRLDNGGIINAGGLGQGRAGNISIHTSGPISLGNGSSISTSAPESSGGNITLRSGGDIRLFSSGISALAGLNGGNVSLGTSSLLYLRESTITGQADASAAGFGNGGNLTLDPSQLVLNDSSLVSKSSLGNGGNISILADYFFTSGGTIDASAPFGLPGSVQLSAPELDLSEIYPGLSVELLDATDLLQPHCGIRLRGNVSSFMVLGRGGLPLAPGGFLPSSMSEQRRTKEQVSGPNTSSHP